MIKTKCQHCRTVILPANRYRTIARVNDSFNIKTFCDEKCADKYFFNIGLQATVIGILVIGLGLAWFLK